MNGNGPTQVIAETPEGFRVYSPANPADTYLVSGGAQNPSCTCPDFRIQSGSPRRPCRHIEAVLGYLKREPTPEEERYTSEERRAIQSEGRLNGKGAEKPDGVTTMLIKRSVSPDGRIDSLSVEFSTPLGAVSETEIRASAARMLGLQSEIVRVFLERNGNGKAGGTAAGNGANPSEATLAEMLRIGGMNGKWGRRLFITVRANGRELMLFGNRNQLSQAIRTAGFPQMAERIEEGVTLGLPCRVITKPSPDGRYVNVERVLPVTLPGEARRDLR